MALKDLMVHLDGSGEAETRLNLAAGLARSHGAHLTGLYVMPPLSPPALPIESIGYIGAADLDSLLARWREQRMPEARLAEEQFREQLRRNGVEGEFRIADGPVAETVARHARYADLAVVGQRDPEQPAGKPAEEILFASGRPMLVVPYAGRFDRVGNTVLVSWNGTREAARAVNDAIPLLERARSVTVLGVNPRRGIAGDGERPATDMARHLARHGIKATAAHTVGGEISVGEAILNYAFDMGADLLVAGGYGHSRVREIMLGGVTRSLFREMTLPVLMSH